MRMAAMVDKNEPIRMTSDATDLNEKSKRFAKHQRRSRLTEVWSNLLEFWSHLKSRPNDLTQSEILVTGLHALQQLVVESKVTVLVEVDLLVFGMHELASQVAQVLELGRLDLLGEQLVRIRILIGLLESIERTRDELRNADHNVLADLLGRRPERQVDVRFEIFGHVG